MNKLLRVGVGVIAGAGLGLAVASASAHPGSMGAGMGPGTIGGVGPHAMGPGAMARGAAGTETGHALLTTEERTALQENMRNAKTPEERQKLAAATRTEVQKRAKDKGITLPEGHDPHFGTTSTAPGNTR